MTGKKLPTAVEALERFFTIVQDEAAANPQFARRLTEALGMEVSFNGEEAVYAVDPMLIADQGADKFRKTFLTFKAKDLKKIMKDFALATPQDFKGRTKPPQLVDLMWERTHNRLYDLKPRLKRAS
ncbi:MAG: hypothetical protein ACR2OX_07245 [Methyloligellaceae bacterium]